MLMNSINNPVNDPVKKAINTRANRGPKPITIWQSMFSRSVDVFGRLILHRFTVQELRSWRVFNFGYKRIEVSPEVKTLFDAF
jgi:hypothetical protein